MSGTVTPIGPREDNAGRKFVDVQMAVSEVIPMIRYIAAAERIPEDVAAALDGVQRILRGISRDLCDLEGEVAHG